MERHERIDRYVEYVPDGCTNRAWAYDFDKTPEQTAAAILAEGGNRNVCIVTTKTTWKGKNGKRTKIEIDRIQLS